MSSSIAQLTKQIRSLPYADMMVIANEITKRLADIKNTQISAQLVANALSSIAVEPIAQSDMTKEEERILGKVFSRKRTISVMQRSTGWEISIPTLQASSVVGTELRPMFGLMLDQVVALGALTERR